MARDNREVGERCLFEYKCLESHDSADAHLWYRSQSPVIVVAVTEPSFDGTLEERGDAGQPRCYRVRFADGYEDEVWEDELVESAADFYQRPPPKPPHPHALFREPVPTG